MDKFEKQFYLFAHALYVCNKEKKYKIAADELLQAINITFENYTITSTLHDHILFPFEFTIINSIAICYYFMKKLDTAIFILQQLMKCLQQKKMNIEEFSKKYPMVTYNLSMWLGIEKRYEESLEVSQKGLDCALKYRRYDTLSGLLYNHGYTLICLGNEDGKKFLQKSLLQDFIIQREASLKLSLQDIQKSFGKRFLNELKSVTIF